MKKVAITGSKGVIGSVLVKGLRDLEIVEIDLPDTDVLNYEAFVLKLVGCEAIIHLAWKYADPDSPEFLDSAKMFENALEASREAGIKRVILASSVHAGDGTSYGELKTKMESLSKEYAENNSIEIIAIRFGGVNREDVLLENEEGYEKIWLRHNDCVAIMQKSIDAETVPGKFEIIYGVSK
ncbi:MAG: NAD(P)-dependent oxidoreductase [Patescibacteria group bacterium]